jgi:hypothetical protein
VSAGKEKIIGMGFGIEGLELLRDKIANDSILEIARLNPKDFTRLRKMGAREIIYYCLNKKGLCTNMETNNYFSKIKKDTSISAQSLFDQRMKLSPLVFKDLNEKYLSAFYSGYPDEVKLFKGYVLLAIDGSDIEIPNTRACINNYGLAGNSKSGVARASISICYDLLNHYILDGVVCKFRTSEIGMAMKHIDRGENIEGSNDQIYIMDRNYVSLGFMQYFEQKGLKFLCRLKANSHYMAETTRMSTCDEIIEIKHTKHRLQRSRFPNEELFQATKSKPHTRVRVVKHPLRSGETEYLITNIKDFSYGDITELYSTRWGIETAYFSLKQKFQIEKFTSSIPQLIEQDFFSSVLAYNIVQSAKNKAEQAIVQTGYKHEMKINESIAIGFVKNELILIMIEDDATTRLQMYDRMVENIGKHKVPIRKGRNFPVKFKRDNKNSINKLRSY